MEKIRIGKDITFVWQVRKDGEAITAEDTANLTLEIAGRNGKFQRLPFEVRDNKIVAVWYGVKQTEVGAYRLTCWYNRGKVSESVVDVVWAVELVQYTTEETFDDIETVTIELDGGNLTFGALRGASAYDVAVAEGFVGTEAEWIASLKKPAEDAAEDAEEAAARAIEAAENVEAAITRAETAAQSAENAAGDANAAAGLANSAANNAEAKAQLADAAANNANTAATEAYSKAQEADAAATTATNAAQSANSAATSANEAASNAVEAAVEATQSAENAQTEAGNAHSAADHAYEMAIGAERVNAQLNGNVLTVTNRQGTSTSVNTKGEQGEQGNPGQAATISVGTTTTGEPGTDAQVTNSGTSSAAVLNFTIPKGAKGDKGDQGDPGEVTEAELEAAVANKANTDGYYSRMIVGGAESLIGDVPQTATYTFRRTGGGAIGEPVARLTEVQGNTGVVNQLVDTNTTEVATISGHKYCTIISGVKSIITSAGSAIAVTGSTDQVFDLTIEYGQGNEPATVDEFAARIWRDYGKTLDEYIAYTQGKLINCKAVALESYNTNSELLDTINLNLTTLTGINPTTGVRETIFPNGMGGGEGWRSALRVVNGAVVAVVNTARMNLGSPEWNYGTQGGNGRFYTDALTPAPWGSAGKAAKIINAAGYVGALNPLGNNDVNMGVAVFSDRFYLRNDSYSDTASFKAAMDGVYFEYQIATPIVYTDLQYADGTPFVLPRNYEVQNDGTERITHADGEDSIAPVMSAIYGLNAVGFVQDAPKDYTSQATLDSLVSVLSSITGRTISKSWNASLNKWEFTSN